MPWNKGACYCVSVGRNAFNTLARIYFTFFLYACNGKSNSTNTRFISLFQISDIASIFRNLATVFMIPSCCCSQRQSSEAR